MLNGLSQEGIAKAKGFFAKIKLMEHVRSGLRRIMSDFLKTQPPEEAAVLAWPVVCGAEVASRTKAVSFAEGRLTIQVPDTGWRNELSALIPRYLSGLDELTPALVKEIKFEVEKSGHRVIGLSGHRESDR